MKLILVLFAGCFWITKVQAQNAIPGGHRGGVFLQIGEHANFMSSEVIPTWVGAYAVHYSQIRADYGAGELPVGLSVRCIKN